MKNILILLRATVLISFIGLGQPLSNVFAQTYSQNSVGTAFTYQGRLIVGTNAVNGLYDFQFALSNAPIGGIQIGSTLTQTGVGVTNGLFTTSLDFGAVFNGIATWLAISVRTNGVGTYTGLNPLQPLTPAPYAIFAENVGSLASGVAVGTGSGNTVASTASQSFVGGGLNNTIVSNANYSVISGGDDNTIQTGNNESFIGGGTGNSILVGGYPGSPDAAIVGGSSNTISDAESSFIGGGTLNFIGSLYGGPSAYNCTISGGFSNNIAYWDNASIICGGWGNVIGPGNGLDGVPDYSVIGGGQGNFVQGYTDHSTISGGQTNLIRFYTSNCTIVGGTGNSIYGGSASTGQNGATICGGYGNAITSPPRPFGANLGTTIAGGYQNTASGNSSFVAGGTANAATADYTFVAGSGAQATNAGAFVWADSQGGTFASTAINQVSFRCGGGVVFTSGNSGTKQTVAWTPGSGSWSFSSDRNLKDRFEKVDSQSVLDKVSQLPIVEWSYKGYPQRHIGAMAQDFHGLFPLNDNDKALNDADLHGVELAAIQGLSQKLNEKDAEIQTLKAKMDELQAMIKQLASQK